jgi:CRISPR-associated protein Csy2
VKQLILSDAKAFVQDVRNSVLGAMKMAGGDVISVQKPEVEFIDERADQDISGLMNKLMPGQALIERRDLVVEAMEDGLDAIDAVMDYLVIHHHSHLQKIESVNKKDSDDKEKDKTEKGQAPEEPKFKVVWTKNRKARGWIVPVACGFQQLTTPSQNGSQRDLSTPHAFAESIVTLGEFIAPYKLKTLKELFWTTDVVAQNNTQLYVCHQNNTTN